LVCEGIAKELDEDGKGIEATVANTSFLGMNALHALGWLGKVPAYRYLVEEVKMDVNKADTAQGNNLLQFACILKTCSWICFAWLDDLFFHLQLCVLVVRIHTPGACRLPWSPACHQIPP
jgi:hypothetical protein